MVYINIHVDFMSVNTSLHLVDTGLPKPSMPERVQAANHQPLVEFNVFISHALNNLVIDQAGLEILVKEMTNVMSTL